MGRHGVACLGVRVGGSARGGLGLAGARAAVGAGAAVVRDRAVRGGTATVVQGESAREPVRGRTDRGAGRVGARARAHGPGCSTGATSSPRSVSPTRSTTPTCMTARSSPRSTDASPSSTGVTLLSPTRSAACSSPPGTPPAATATTSSRACGTPTSSPGPPTATPCPNSVVPPAWPGVSDPSAAPCRGAASFPARSTDLSSTATRPSGC